MNQICFSIVSHGHGKLLNRLLSQLNCQPSISGAKVIITLNIFDEEFDDTAYNNLSLKILRNRTPKGFGANHNTAFESCNSNWFGILNPDLMLLNQEPFTEMITRQTEMEQYDDELSMQFRTAIIAPLVLNTELIIDDSVRSNLTPYSLISRALGFRNYISPTDSSELGNPFFWVAGMCLLVRSDAYRSISGFDERFFLYCEDFDLCARLYNDGWSIKVDKLAKIIHEAQRDSRRSFIHLFWHITSLFKVWTSNAYWKITLN